MNASNKWWRSLRAIAIAMLLATAVTERSNSADDTTGSGVFTIKPRLEKTAEGRTLFVAVGVPPRHILYADKLAFALSTAGGTNVTIAPALPEPTTVTDKFSGKEKRVFRDSFEARVTLGTEASGPVQLAIHYQGCDDANCFFPEDAMFSITADGVVAALESDPEPGAPIAADTGWRKLAEGFTVSARGSGYLSEKEFLAFLDKSKSGEATRDEWSNATGPWSLLLTVCLILLGGAALNLTPCVLPMIPINIAIIGAGAQAGSKRRGFALGTTYAAGMAIAYGVLGLFVVLTGSKFGTLNSSPWFNLIIAIVFAVLALGMFDILAIDLSRFQGQSGGSSAGSSRSKFFAAYSMGTVAALLAGACVAPVVISVLLQATTLYNKGVILGLALPFLLGIGMGLPWPFAGAGLSFLPKPGRWMARVKYGFGALIILFAVYYGHISFSLFRIDGDSPITASATTPHGAKEVSISLGDELARGLAEARRTGQPVFVDFWASWCKNCSAMEHSTFESAEVKRSLAGYRQIRLQAEQPNRAPSKEILDYFNVLGLPSFLVLTPPGNASTPAPQPAAATAFAR